MNDEVGGNPSKCDGCPIPIDQCQAICEGCEEKKEAGCQDICPKDCGVLDDGPDEP